MRYLILLLLCMCLCLAGGYKREYRKVITKTVYKMGPKMRSGSLKNAVSTDYIASVVQLPSVYHRCNAFFVSDNILIAPATCVLCNELCDFQIAIDTHYSVFSQRHLFEVENVTIHPKFLLLGNNDNPSYNIAVLKLTDAKINVKPLSIWPAPVSKEGYLRSWVFKKDMSDFFLKTHIFEKITHYICEENGVNVKLDEICVQTTSPVDLGRFNEGAVFVIDGDTSNSPSSPMGFYGKSQDFSGPSKYYSFVSVMYYYDWLSVVIDELSSY